MIGRNGERGSGISVRAALHDDDDDNDAHYSCAHWPSEESASQWSRRP